LPAESEGVLVRSAIEIQGPLNTTKDPDLSRILNIRAIWDHCCRIGIAKEWGGGGVLGGFLLNLQWFRDSYYTSTAKLENK
jgi:hypothetical protein